MTAAKRRLLVCALVLALILGLGGLIPVDAWADGEIGSLSVSLSQVPVYTNGVYSATVSVNTANCSIISYGWYDASGPTSDEVFGRDSYRLEVVVAANSGYYFSQALTVTLDGTTPNYSVASDGSSVTVSRDFIPQVWSPQLIKSPTSETVDEGEMAPFTAQANYCDTHEWIATSPDGSVSVNCYELPDLFPGVTIGGDGKEKMNIRNVPAEMNGWTVYCVFTGPGGSMKSGSATITVRSAATPSPSPSPSSSPSPSPSASPSPSPSASPDPDEDHIHTFQAQWQMDDQRHWRECACGEQTDLGEHTMVWTASEEDEDMEDGVCSVCGYTDTREAEGSSISLMGWLFIGLLVAIGLIVLGLVLSSASQRRSRRRRNSRRRYR